MPRCAMDCGFFQTFVKFFTHLQECCG
jgi:hypothetical protein